MNAYIKIVVISIVLLEVIGYGCSNSEPKISRDLQESFKNQVPVNDMNKSFCIWVDSSNYAELKFGSDIYVVIENLSDQQIFFPLGYGTRLFIVRDNKWVEIMNKNEYYGNGSILFPKGIQLGYLISTGIRPIIGPNIKYEGNQEILRIVIIGELISDGKKTGISAGAYTDVFVNP